MKILITSDNHLGYKENDPIRREDSYRTFEEILILSKIHNVDLVIQGGDLFHDNRPSRYCINKTINLLKKYCLGSNRSNLDSSRMLNTSYDNMSINLPVIAIHGNHDDPSGINHISPMHILESAGLVNYIGATIKNNLLVVKPIIISKTYKIALYAIGHIQDSKLYRMFAEGKVVFEKHEDYRNCYNILVVHQNRVPRGNNYLPEKFIDDFFDLVVYGHEHDNMIVKYSFVLLQSGSTVRTSLSQSELFDKYAYILDVSNKPTLSKIKLHTVRSFCMDTISLADGYGEKEIKDKIGEMVSKCQEEFKNNIIEIDNKIKELELSRNMPNDVYQPLNDIVPTEKYADSSFFEETKIADYCIGFHNDRWGYLDIKNLIIENLSLPLIRLRVEIKDALLNRNAINLFFKGKVANFSEIVTFIRKKIIKETTYERPKQKIELAGILEDVFSDVRLGVVPENKLIESLYNFVEKGDKNAFSHLIKDNISKLVGKINLIDVLATDVENEFLRHKIKENDLTVAEKTYEDSKINRELVDSTGEKEPEKQNLVAEFDANPKRVKSQQKSSHSDQSNLKKCDISKEPYKSTTHLTKGPSKEPSKSTLSDSKIEVLLGNKTNVSNTSDIEINFDCNSNSFIDLSNKDENNRTFSSIKNINSTPSFSEINFSSKETSPNNSNLENLNDAGSSTNPGFNMNYKNKPNTSSLDENKNSIFCNDENTNSFNRKNKKDYKNEENDEPSFEFEDDRKIVTGKNSSTLRKDVNVAMEVDEESSISSTDIFFDF